MDKCKTKELILDLFGVEADHPFAGDPGISVFRHASNNKWFGVIMSVPKNRLGLSGDEAVDIINLKCPKEIIYSVTGEDGIFPAYHMSKTNWISVLLDGTVDSDTLKWLLSISFDATMPKKRKRPLENTRGLC